MCKRGHRRRRRHRSIDLRGWNYANNNCVCLSFVDTTLPARRDDGGDGSKVILYHDIRWKKCVLYPSGSCFSRWHNNMHIIIICTSINLSILYSIYDERDGNGI
jgi:hypothetical protein